MKMINTSKRDLEVAGRVYPAGEAVEVGAGEASYLASNPNFREAPAARETADSGGDAGAGDTVKSDRPRAGKKG